MLLSYKHVHLQAQQRLQEEGCVVDITQHVDWLTGLVNNIRSYTLTQ